MSARAGIALVAAVLVAACSSQVASAPPAASSAAAIATSGLRSAGPSKAPLPTPNPPPIWQFGQGQLVFEDYRISAGQHQLWITDGSGSVRRLISSAFDDVRPSLSPDGKTVLFTRLGDGGDQAYLVDVDGTNLRPLKCGPELCDPEGDAWSPNGRQLVIDRAFPPLFTDANGDEAATNVSIWVVNVDGSGVHEVTKNPREAEREDHRPVWSPDGKHIAFARTDYSVKPNRAAIFSVAPNGTGIRQVTPWALDANEPDWSPDGSLIAFSSPAGALQPGREQNIFTIHPDGTGLRQLTAHLSAGPDGSQGTFDPSWSPDGKQLVFTHIPSTDGLADLYVVNADGTGMHVVAETPSLNESHAVWGILPAP